MNIISLGAGVQSSTMALMAAHGEITPMPDCAIFADTQAEPKAVYTWLDWLEKQLPFPVHRVTEGSLYKIIGQERPTGKWRHMPIPAFVETPDGKGGLLNRSCTKDYKLTPLRRKVRQLLGIDGKRSPAEPVVTQWIGISTDEAQRMKPSRETWQVNRWPLIEHDISRMQCIEWMKSKGYATPPKSSCTFCPYHSRQQWMDMKKDKDSWEQIVSVDTRIRDLWHGRAGKMFLHNSLKPIAEIVFERDEDKQIDMFANECEGMCGV